MQPVKAKARNNSGIAVISLDFSDTFTCPKANRFSVAHALSHVDGAEVCRTIVRAAQLLTIHRHDLPTRYFVDRLHPADKARLKLLWVKPLQVLHFNIRNGVESWCPDVLLSQPVEMCDRIAQF